MSFNNSVFQQLKSTFV